MKVVVLLALSAAAPLVPTSAGQAATLPTVTVVDSDGNAAESGANSGSFRITRSGSTGSPLTVRYALGGSAANGADYAALSGSVTIPAGSSSAMILVDTIDDSAPEGDENVVLTLSPDAAYVIGTPDRATVDMEDNDGEPPPTAPTVTVVASDANASEDGPNSGVFTLTRTGDTTSALAVTYSLDGNAVNGSDYSSLPGSVVIAPGSASVNVTVDPIDDAAAEGDERVVLTISADAAYTVGSPKSATVTIADNEQPPTLPTVTVVDSDGNAAESGANSGSFRISRTGSTASALNVRYSLGGSAVNGADYAVLSGSVTIPAGSVSATILVNTIDDSAREGDENVVLTLAPTAAYVIGTPNRATVDMEDNDSSGPTLPVLAIARAADPNVDGVMISWNSEAGQRYQLQAKSGWSTTNWINLGSVITATGGASTAFDPINSEQQRVYRLVVLP